MPENIIKTKLNKKKILIADGATGTNLQQRGLKKGMAAEVWVLEKPEEIIRLHRDFLDSGADIILTCTFGASPLRLAQSNLKDKTEEINRKAVELAKVAASGTACLVAGSIGPLGYMLKPFGDLEIEVAKDNFSKQAQGLVSGCIDFFLIETQFDINESKAAIAGIRSVSDLPIICSFSYDRGTKTMMGVSPSQAANELMNYDITALGINCGKSLENNLKALQELNQATRLPIWFKPNAGIPKVDGEGVPIYDITPEMMGEQVSSWIEAGAQIIGGCCGTSPQHLKTIAAAVQKYSAVQ